MTVKDLFSKGKRLRFGLVSSPFLQVACDLFIGLTKRFTFIKSAQISFGSVAKASRFNRSLQERMMSSERYNSKAELNLRKTCAHTYRRSALHRRGSISGCTSKKHLVSLPKSTNNRSVIINLPIVATRTPHNHPTKLIP